MAGPGDPSLQHSPSGLAAQGAWEGLVWVPSQRGKEHGYWSQKPPFLTCTQPRVLPDL